MAGLLEGYEALAEECASALTEEERKEADLCAKYLVEQHQLKLLIQICRDQEELTTAQTELRELQDACIPSRIALLIGAALCAAGTVSLFFWTTSEQTTGNEWMPELGILFSGVIICLLAANSPNQKKAKLQRETVEAMVPCATLSRHPPATSSRWPEELRGKSVSELKAIQGEREILINKILKTATTETEVPNSKDG